MSIAEADWVGATVGEGRYSILRRLGEGGMGFVYLADDRNLDKQVVIKVPRQQMYQDPTFGARFEREIRSLVKLNHPHIVTILDVGKHERIPFAVMDFLAGKSLEDRMPRGADGRIAPMPVGTLETWLPATARALDFVHKQGYLHRDVKPANILFDEHDNAFLSDFGIITTLAQESQSRQTKGLTAAGMVIGTPEYMAPELIMDQQASGRADQYSLAMTVYEVLSGGVPFEGAPTAIMMHQVNNQVPPLSTRVEYLPPAISAVVERGLAKSPEDRYETCHAFATAMLEAFRRAAKRCPACGNRLPLKSEHVGRKVRCSNKACGARLRVGPDFVVGSLDAAPPAPAGQRSALDASGTMTLERPPSGSFAIDQPATIEPEPEEPQGRPAETAAGSPGPAVETMDEPTPAPASGGLPLPSKKVMLVGGIALGVVVLLGSVGGMALMLAGSGKREAGDDAEVAVRKGRETETETEAEPTSAVSAEASGPPTTDGKPRLADDPELTAPPPPIEVARATSGLQPGLGEPETAEPIDPLGTFSNSIGMRFVELPRGTVPSIAGLPGGTPNVERFAIGAYEVTQGQFERVMGYDPSFHSGPDEAELPVERVSYAECEQFCRKLSALPQERKANRTYRLPTEAEWAHACLGQVPTAYGYGDELPSDVNIAWRNTATVRVGSSPSTKLGLFDIHGNVWEWCAAEQPDSDRAPARGGSFRTPPLRGAVFAREYFGKLNGDNIALGFRVACDLPEDTKRSGPRGRSATAIEPPTGSFAGPAPGASATAIPAPSFPTAPPKGFGGGNRATPLGGPPGVFPTSRNLRNRLLDHVDLTDPGGTGWMRAGAMVRAVRPNPEPLEFAVALERDYDLIFEYVTTIEKMANRGGPGVAITFPVGDRSVSLVLQACDGDCHGLSLVNGHAVGSPTNPTTVNGPLPAGPRPSSARGVEIQVRSNTQPASVVVTIDGTPLVDWSGDARFLQPPPEYASRDRRHVSVHVQGDVLVLSRADYVIDPSP